MQESSNTLTSSTKMFAWMTTAFFTLLIVAYSLIRPQQSSMDLRGLIQSVFLGVICLIGFSLIQLYKSKNSWAVLPMNLFLVSASFLCYFVVNFIVMRSVNPLGKASSDITGDISLSGFSQSNSNPTMDFNEGQTVMSCFRFCLVMVIGCSAFTGMDVVLSLLLVVIVCPFYVFNSLALLAVKFLDAGGSIQLFTFAGTFGFLLEVLMRYKGIFSPTLNTPKNVRSSGIGYALMVLGSVVIWTLLPIIMETKVLSTNLNTNIKGPNPAAAIQLENLWGSLVASLLGVLASESMDSVKSVRAHTMIYAFICSSVTICTASEFITMPFLTTVIGFSFGYIYDTLFRYFDELKEEKQEQDEATCCQTRKINRAFHNTLMNSGGSLFGFFLSGVIGSFIAFALCLIQLIEWLNPRWPDPNPLQVLRFPPHSAGIILAGMAITFVIAMLAAWTVFGLLLLLHSRNPEFLKYTNNFEMDVQMDEPSNNEVELQELNKGEGGSMQQLNPAVET